MIVAGVWQESDSQIWKIAGPWFQNFGTGAELESEKVTPATSDMDVQTRDEHGSGLDQDWSQFWPE